MYTNFERWRLHGKNQVQGSHCKLLNLRVDGNAKIEHKININVDGVKQTYLTPQVLLKFTQLSELNQNCFEV